MKHLLSIASKSKNDIIECQKNKESISTSENQTIGRNVTIIDGEGGLERWKGRAWLNVLEMSLVEGVSLNDGMNENVSPGKVVGKDELVSLIINEIDNRDLGLFGEVVEGPVNALATISSMTKGMESNERGSKRLSKREQQREYEEEIEQMQLKRGRRNF